MVIRCAGRGLGLGVRVRVLTVRGDGERVW